jgi:hypothetical protein
MAKKKTGSNWTQLPANALKPNEPRLPLVTRAASAHVPKKMVAAKITPPHITPLTPTKNAPSTEKHALSTQNRWPSRRSGQK